MLCVITRIRQGEKQIQFLIKKKSSRVTVKANLQVKEKNMREIFVIQNHLNVFKCLTIVYLRHNPHLCFDGLKK